MTLKEGNLWYKFEGPSCYGNHVVYTHFILQWYETHTMLCNDMKCIPVLILKSQIHKFSQTNNFSQINKFFVYYGKRTIKKGNFVIVINSSRSRTRLSHFSRRIWEIHAEYTCFLRLQLLAKIGYIPQCKGENPRGLYEISFPLTRMQFCYRNGVYI